MIAAEERSAWVTPLHWDGTAWSYAWGSFQDLEWARRTVSSRAEGFTGRASLVRRLLQHNDRVVTLGDDTSIQVYRRFAALDCIVVDSYPPLTAGLPAWASEAVSRAEIGRVPAFAGN